jgi:hypothetical protein
MSPCEDEEDFTPVDELEGALDPSGKEIDGNTHRLFRCRATILFRDHLAKFMAEQGRFFLFDGTLAFDNPVPLTDAGGTKPLGFANVTWEGDRLEAVFSIPYSSPERLVIETTDVWAETSFRASPSEPLRLQSLFLSGRRPTDERETPLRPVESP